MRVVLLALFVAGCASASPPAEKKPTWPSGKEPPSPPRRGGQAPLDEALSAARAGNLELAIAKSREAIEAAPQLEQAYLLLGSSCAMLQDEGCEREAYASGLSAVPKSAALQREMGFLLLRDGDVADGVAALEAARSAKSPPPAEWLADLAIAYKMAERFEDAEATAALAVSADPKCLPCLLAQGTIRAAASDFPGAEAAFAAGIELAPDNLEARRSLAKAVLQGGDVNRAADLFLDIARRAPEDVRARLQAGQVLLKAGRPKDAVVELGAASDLLPEEPRVLELLADAQKKAGQPAAAKATRAKAAKLRSLPSKTE